MLTNQDIDEAMATAEMDADDMIQSAVEEFYRPDVEREARILWADLPEAVKRVVRQRMPDAVKRIES